MNFKQVYDAHFPFVWRTLRRLGLSEADAADAAQEVFLVVHRRLPSFEGRCKLTTWLFRITQRIARDGRERAHRRFESKELSESDGHTHADSNPAQRLERKQDLDLLDAALSDLPPGQREVFMLFELEEMTGDEVAEALDIPLGTVYSRLRLARNAFRAAIRRQVARRSHPIELQEKTA